MKQTAVEWLMEEYINGLSINLQIMKKALEMEKEQLCYFYIKGAEAEMNNPYVTNIEFYNKTFKNTEQ